MNYYNSKFPLIFAPKGRKEWAITLFQRTWYSVPDSEVDAAWRRHEDHHKFQQKRDGFKFYFKYLYWLWKFGYENNPYEIDAREAENVRWDDGLV